MCGPHDAPGFDVMPSRERNNCTYYLAAGGEKLPNLGETHFRTNTQEGRHCKVRLQVTNVRKPLLSVGRVCDEGNQVIFANNVGCVDHLGQAGACTSSGRGVREQHGSGHCPWGGFCPAGTAVGSLPDGGESVEG